LANISGQICQALELFILIKAKISPEESILHNLNTWCYEVGTEFEEMGKLAAIDFMSYMDNSYVLELGCGDGASIKTFIKYKWAVLAIDINPHKLEKIKGIATLWESDMLTALRTLKDNSVSNIFAHHSLEHVVNVEEVLKEISRVIKPGGYFYAVVPANDYLHSVHHVVFESPEELLQPEFKIIKAEKQIRNEPEYICVAQKLV